MQICDNATDSVYFTKLAGVVKFGDGCFSVPYAFLYFVAELAAINIKVKLDVEFWEESSRIKTNCNFSLVKM